MQKAKSPRFTKSFSMPLLCMVGLVILTRLPQVLTGSVAFGFDHGRDALAILHIVKTLHPTLIGPWTSIPGLFFGPGWYYLLAPISLLTNGHPVAPTVMMIMLIVLQVVLAFRFFGKLTALIIAGAPLWMIISTSAWNPYPMPLLTLVILILFQRAQLNHNRLSLKQAALIGIAAGFGFHFSTAYAVFYPIIIIFTLLLKKIRVSPKVFLLGCLAFMIPFVPQLVFEAKYHFQEVNAVMQYLKEGQKADAADRAKIGDVLTVSLNEVKLAVLPEIWVNNQIAHQVITVISTLMVLAGLIIAVIKKRVPRELVEICCFLLVPLIGFTFLHFNLWYLLGLMPAAVLLVSFAVKQLPKPVQLLFVIMMIITPMSLTIRFWLELPKQRTNVSLLPVKLQAINEIRKRAGNQPFASYHYAPDIYDFSYQYIYIWQGFNGMSLPTEFSYKPGEIIYIPQKPDLLAALKDKIPTGPPQKIFFIIEKGGSKELLDSWWHQQRYGQIVETVQIGPNVQVIEATP